MTFKELLKEKDFSGAQIARRLDLSSSAVSKWMVGLAEPSLTSVVALSKILNVSVETVVNCFVEGA